MTDPAKQLQQMFIGAIDMDRAVDALMGTTCRHCGRRIEQVEGLWIDPEATGDDSIWRETCDEHDTFTAEHEPTGGAGMKRYQVEIDAPVIITVIAEDEDAAEAMGDAIYAKVWDRMNEAVSNAADLNLDAQLGARYDDTEVTEVTA